LERRVAVLSGEQYSKLGKRAEEALRFVGVIGEVSDAVDLRGLDRENSAGFVLLVTAELLARHDCRFARRRAELVEIDLFA
jgi:hypothetical protein